MSNVSIPDELVHKIVVFVSSWGNTNISIILGKKIFFCFIDCEKVKINSSFMLLALKSDFEEVVHCVPFKVVWRDLASLNDIIENPAALRVVDIADHLFCFGIVMVPSRDHVAIEDRALICEDTQLVLARGHPEIQVLLQFAS